MANALESPKLVEFREAVARAREACDRGDRADERAALWEAVDAISVLLRIAGLLPSARKRKAAAAREDAEDTAMVDEWVGRGRPRGTPRARKAVNGSD